MKKLLFRVHQKAVSGMLAISMMFGICYNAFPKTSETVFADTSEETVVDDGVINYVALGDSMTNGYGLDGYNKEGGRTYEPLNGYFHHGYASYPVHFAQWLEDNNYAETVKLYDMAMSAMRAEDLNFVLNFDYTNTENLNFVTEDIGSSALSSKWINGKGAEWREKLGAIGDAYTWDEFTDSRFSKVQMLAMAGKTEQEKVAQTAKEYQEAVKNADIISMCMGNANFGVFMFGRLMNAINFGAAEGEVLRDKDAWILYELENMQLDPAINEIVVKAEDMLRDELSSQIPAESYDLVDYALKITRFTIVSYLMNYTKAVETIVTVNPDVEIMFVGLVNALTGMTIGSVDLGDYMQKVYDLLNSYVSMLPTLLKLNGKGREAKYYFAETENNLEMIASTYDDIQADAWGNNVSGLDGKTIRDRMVREYDKMLYPLVGGVINDLLEQNGLPISASKIMNEDDAKFEEFWNSASDYEAFANDWYNYIDEYESYLANKDSEDVLRPSEPDVVTESGKTISYALYFAFEKATIDSVEKGITWGTLEALMGNDLGSALGGVAAKLSGVLNIDTITAMVMDSVTAAGAKLESTLTARVREWAVNNASAGVDLENPQAVLAAYIQSRGDEAWIEEYKQLKEDCGIHVDDNPLTTEPYLVNTINASTMKYAERYIAASIQMELPGALDSISGLLNLYARCLVGNGLGGHPSGKGHETMFNAITKAYAEGCTTEDALLDKAEEAFVQLGQLVQQYGPQIAKDAYQYAVDAGYVEYVENTVAGFKAELIAVRNDLLNLRQQILNMISALPTKPGANSVVSEIQNQLNAAAAFIDAKIEEIDLMINDMKNVATQTVKELVVTIQTVKDQKVAQIKAAVEACVNQMKETVEAQMNVVKTTVENTLVAINAKCMETVLFVEERIERLEAAVQQKYLEVMNEIKVTCAKIEATIACIEMRIQVAVTTLAEIYKGVFVVEYVKAEEDTISYLALGDAAVNGYADAVAAEWGADVVVCDEVGTVTALAAKLGELASDIMNADVISVGFSNNAILDIVADQILKEVHTDYSPVALDWAALVTEDGVEYVEKALTALRAELVKADLGEANVMGYTISVADLLMVAIENYVYNYLEFSLGYMQVANAIAEINPEAKILMVGMYNPFQGLEVNNIAIGDYVECLVNVVEVQYAVYAGMYSNVAFVDISEVVMANGGYEGKPITNVVMDLLVENFKVGLLPSAESYDYIAQQIVGAVEFVTETLGDVNGDGIVDLFDLLALRRYLVGDAVEICEGADMTKDGVVDLFDLLALRQYLVA